VLHTLGRHCPWVETVACVSAGDAGVQALAAGCPHLAELRLHHAEITDAALDALGAHCRRLRDMVVSACPQVTEAGLAGLLSACRRLRGLTISHPTFDAAVKERLKNCRPEVHVTLYCTNGIF
jgi:hypothetical protein